jgi:hypothetical protein
MPGTAAGKMEKPGEAAGLSRRRVIMNDAPHLHEFSPRVESEWQSEWLSVAADKFEQVLARIKNDVDANGNVIDAAAAARIEQCLVDLLREARPLKNRTPPRPPDL